MQKSSFLFSLIVAVVSFHLPAYAACPARLVNNTTADAGPVMDWFDCKASLDGASFSGSVGIGTSPDFRLSVDDGGTGDTARFVSTANPTILLTKAGVFSQTIFKDGLGLGLTTNDGGATALYVQGSNGSIGLGTTSPNYRLEVNGDAAGTSAYQNLSDARLKKNIVPIRDALTIISQLRGVRFDWRSPVERSIGKTANLAVGTPQIGFVAQELQKVLPEAVSVANDKDRTMSIAESKVVPVLVEAMKEQQAIIAKQALEISAIHKELGNVERKRAVRTASK